MNDASLVAADLSQAPWIPAPDRPSAEFVGRARQFRTWVTASAEASGSIMQAIGRDAFTAWRRRKPGSGLRDDMLLQLEQRWRGIPSPGGISQTCSRERHGIVLSDTRIRPEIMISEAWADGGKEPAITVVVTTLEVSRRRAATTSTTLASFSLHAMARFYQKSFAPTDEALREDIAAIAAAAPILTETEGRFDLPTGHGTWFGVTADFKDIYGRSAPTANVRTFY